MSEADVLSRYAARRGDGRLLVMLINKSGDPLVADVALAGYAPAAGTAARLFTLEGSGQPAGPLDRQVVYNGVARTAPGAQVLPPPRLLHVTSGAPLVVPLAPYSLAVVELAPPGR